MGVSLAAESVGRLSLGIDYGRIKDHPLGKAKLGGPQILGRLSNPLRGYFQLLRRLSVVVQSRQQINGNLGFQVLHQAATLVPRACSASANRVVLPPL